MKISYGLSGDAPVPVVEAVSHASEELGYATFWLNYPRSRPGADGLAAMPLASANTRTIHIGMGIVPLTVRPAEEIVAWFDENPYPLDRLWLGVGSGSGGPGALDRVRDGVLLLRERLSCRVVVAAYGEKMCRLGGEVADGVLLNFVTPEAAATRAAWVREAAEAVGRETPQVQAYVRIAVGDGAAERVVQDAASHVARHPEHFAEGDDLRAAVVITAGEDPRPQLDAWAGALDELVLKPLPTGKSVEEHLALVSVAAPRREVSA